MNNMTAIKFSACPRCRKRGDDRKGDNLAEYKDNYYCFKCGYYESKRTLERVNDAYSQHIAEDNRQLDTIKQLPDVARQWLNKWQLTLDELDCFRWNEEKQLLVMVNLPTFWHGRCFAPFSKSKYLSNGIKPFLQWGQSDTIVLVEDVISALKVGRVATGCPLFGTMPYKLILDGLERYKNIFIWLDKDAAIKSLKTARITSELIGKPIRVIITEKDPKYYNDLDLYNYIYN
jgi:ribosomal protein S27AE